MELKLRDGKSIDISFWSFFKLYILSQSIVLGITIIVMWSLSLWYIFS